MREHEQNIWWASKESKMEKVKAKNSQIKHKFVRKFLHKNMLMVDHEYQRMARMTRVRAMAGEKFDPALAGVVYVSHRADGTYCIMDGQNRWESACRSDDVTTLDCFVFEGLTPQQEAEMFYTLNAARSPVKALELFHAKRAADDPKALWLDEFITVVLRRTVDTGKSRQVNAIRCITALETCQRINKEALSSIGSLLRDFCKDERIDGDVVLSFFYTELGLHDARGNKRSLTEKNNRDKLRHFDPAALLRKILHFKSLGNSVHTARIAALLDFLNKGRRTRRLVVTVTSGDDE